MLNSNFSLDGQTNLILLVRDNMALLCARTPTFPGPEVDGDDEF